MVKTYQPTSAVLENIQKGQALSAKFNRSTPLALSVSEEITKSKEDFAGEFTLNVVKSMYNVLKNLEPKIDVLKRLEDGGPSDELIKFYAFGGSAGLAWTRMILKQENILKSYQKEITEEEINKSGDDVIGKLPVSKAVNDELKQATFIVMVPDEVDLHGDITSEDEVRKACHNFNKYCRTANLFHLVKSDTFEFAESYCAPTDFVLGDKFVKKGTWLATIQALDDDLWDLIKSGEICALSIGAMANVEAIDE